jgi:hypothetical protein
VALQVFRVFWLAIYGYRISFWIIWTL